jgi:hypothetical protein
MRPDVETELADMGLIDWSGVLALAADGASSHRLSGLPVLMLDVPVTSHAELAFVSALAASAPELLATVPSADEPTLARLRWSVQDLDSGHQPAAPLRRLQRNLFREEIAPESTGVWFGME